MNKNRFVVGDLVEWDTSSSQYFDIHKGHEKLCGSGPFEVIKLVDMPPDLLKSEKHSQWVYIKTSGGGIKCFSGFWFKKV
jgi:hypothetical protein